jgi:hypothetical protein
MVPLLRNFLSSSRIFPETAFFDFPSDRGMVPTPPFYALVTASKAVPFQKFSLLVVVL